MRIRFAVFSLLFALHLGAQTESLDHFSEEVREVILRAAETHVKSLTIYVNTHQSDNFRGDKDRMKVRFINDSLFEQKTGFHKELMVIRNRNFFPYDPAQKSGPALSGLQVKDSANCRVYWGRAVPGMDSNMISYCRFTYDSLQRKSEYYFTFNKMCIYQNWSYEVDSLVYNNFWSIHADTMRHIYSAVTYELYNADSTLLIRVAKLDHFPNEPGAAKWFSRDLMTTHIAYDDQGRLLSATECEFKLGDDDSIRSTEIHTLRVEYH